jgi:TIR domain
MIAISYRRGDSLAIAGRLYDRLQSKFGRKNVFMDFDSIPPGVDFRNQIKQTIERSDLVIALIGPNWVGELTNGSRRIDDPTDFVRLEIEYALKRGIPIIPLLVNDTAMPKPENLPDAIEGLAFRNAWPLNAGIDFNSHAERVINGISGLPNLRSKLEADAPLPEELSSRSGRRPLKRLLGFASLILAVAAVAFVVVLGRERLSYKTQADNVAKSESSPPSSASPMPTAAVAAKEASVNDQAKESLSALETQLIGIWQGKRHTTEYLPNHTFKQNGLHYPDMKWRLEGRTLIQNYPDIGDAIPAWYPTVGELSVNILFVTQEKLVVQFGEARSTEFRIKSDTREEIEAAATRADAANKELAANPSRPVDWVPPPPGSARPASEIKRTLPQRQHRY